MFGKSKLNMKNVSFKQPTSVMDLKEQCIRNADGDLEQAKKLYDFFIDGVTDLPTFDPKEPSTMDKIKGMLGDGVAWYKNNQDEIAKVVSVIQTIRGKGGAIPMDVVPTPAEATAPLDPIN